MYRERGKEVEKKVKNGGKKGKEREIGGMRRIKRKRKSWKERKAKKTWKRVVDAEREREWEWVIVGKERKEKNREK